MSSFLPSPAVPRPLASALSRLRPGARKEGTFALPQPAGEENPPQPAPGLDGLEAARALYLIDLQADSRRRHPPGRPAVLLVEEALESLLKLQLAALGHAGQEPDRAALGRLSQELEDAGLTAAGDHSVALRLQLELRKLDSGQPG